MSIRESRVLLFAVAGALLLAASLPADDIPRRPEELEFGPLEWEVPRAEEIRHELPGGIPAYVIEDRDLPLATIGVQLRIGSFLEPADKVGLASMTGVLMRSGGAGERTPRELDERVDALAADLSTGISDTQGRASINCLTAVLDECLDLFFEVLREPRFDVDRLALEKANTLERLEQRNDNPGSIEFREWGWLLYGDHFSVRQVTGASLEAIGRDDLVAFHEAYWRPEHMVFTVTGDVDTDAILERLAEGIADWPGQGESFEWPPPKPSHEPTPGLYYVDKDIPQSRVSIGQLAFQYDWDSPDLFPLMVMNDVLGGSGFTSRLTKRIRSDEGLAYSAGSSLSMDTWWQGTFRVFFQTKNPTVAYATGIARQELDRIRAESVTEDELSTAVNSIVDSFPRRFDSPSATASIFAGDEMIGRPHSYWYGYRERVREVSPAEVQRVAEQYLDPASMLMLVVGKWEEVEPGDADGRGTIEGLWFDDATQLPLRDPVSLEPIDGE